MLQVHGASIILKKRIILKLIQGYPDWNTKMDMRPDFGMNIYHICVRNSMEPTLVQVNFFGYRTQLGSGMHYPKEIKIDL